MKTLPKLGPDRGVMVYTLQLGLSWLYCKQYFTGYCRYSMKVFSGLFKRGLCFYWVQHSYLYMDIFNSCLDTGASLYCSVQQGQLNHTQCFGRDQLETVLETGLKPVLFSLNLKITKLNCLKRFGHCQVKFSKIYQLFY